MAESFLNNARALALSPLVESQIDDLVRLVVADIRALPHDLRQSGDDSRLDSVWEEFKYQLQREESATFEAYEFEIRRICRRRTDELAWPLRLLLWCWTDRIVYWDEESLPHPEEIAGEVAEALYKRVCAEAVDEELAHDPDEPLPNDE